MLVTYFHLGLSWTTLNLARRRLIITDNRSVFPPALFAFLVCSTVLKTQSKMHPRCAIISKYLHSNVNGKILSLILQNKYFRIYENSFGAKILRILYEKVRLSEVRILE